MQQGFSVVVCPLYSTFCQAAVLGDEQALEDVHGTPRSTELGGRLGGLRGLKGVKRVKGVRG